jgi:hypothetical protein
MWYGANWGEDSGQDGPQQFFRDPKPADKSDKFKDEMFCYQCNDKGK